MAEKVERWSSTVLILKRIAASEVVTEKATSWHVPTKEGQKLSTAESG